MDRNRLAAILSGILLWLGYTLAWLDRDNLLRDGDEDGHIGAAEIFKEQWLSGNFVDYLHLVWTGDFGDYPNLFSGALGAWWALVGGQPEDLLMRVFPVLGMGLSIAGFCIMLRPTPNRLLAAIYGLLLLPMANGICRHYMPEGLVMGVLVLSMGIGLWLIRNPSFWGSILWGTVLGLGLLTKHNFVILAWVPTLWIIYRLRLKSIPAILMALFVSLPWYVTVGLTKQTYLMSTLQAPISWWTQLLAHPIGFLWDGLGPVLSIGLLFSLRPPKSDTQTLSFLWLIGGLIGLCLLPKQYPRLLLPLIPAAIVLISIRVEDLSTGRVIGLTLPLFAWLHLSSIVNIPSSTVYSVSDSGCPQHWLRPPHPTDFGFSGIKSKLSQSSYQGIVVTDDLNLPCSVQTTHSGSYHLEYYLRRRAYDGPIHIGQPAIKGLWLGISWPKQDSTNEWKPKLREVEQN